MLREESEHAPCQINLLAIRCLSIANSDVGMISFLFKIWGLAKPYRWRLFIGVVTGILAGASETSMVVTVAFVYSVIFPTAKLPSSGQAHEVAGYIPQSALDWVDNARQSMADSVQAHHLAVIGLVALIPAVVLVRGVLTYFNVYCLQWVAVRTVTDLRTRLFDHLMHLSAGFFSDNNSGDLISRITNDTAVLQGIIGNATSVVAKDPATLIFTLTTLLLLNPRLTLISFVVMPLCVIPIAIYGRKTRKSAKKMQAATSELTSVMSESFTGNRIIKAYNLEENAVGQFQTAARKLIGDYMRIVRAQETPGPLMEFFGAIGLALVIFYLTGHSEGAPNAGDFIRLIGSIFIMYRPIKNLARLQNSLEQAKAASARVFELLATENSIPEPANPKPLKAAGAEIRFENIYFNYDTREILRGVDLVVKPGQMVALVGRSGSGKTTLANLLLRFYDPLKGAVRIGGVDIREVSSTDLRNQIAMVTQETLLFNQSIRRNIELGRPGAPEIEIVAAAQHAYAHQFILEKDGGYTALIGEKGITLSGGQKQRLAIARAILKNAPILILDEATSALDNESERAVQAALEELMRNRTTICIAHRLSTIQKADVIVVLDQGRIVEMGTHDELLKRNGAYRRLHELDSGPKPQEVGK
jgi:ATP-binding cassette, subfamily B, bacterial MsbA